MRTATRIADVDAKLDCIIGPNGTGSRASCARCASAWAGASASPRPTRSRVRPRLGQRGTSAGSRSAAGGGDGLYDGPANAVVRVEFDVDNKQAWTLDGKASTQKAVRWMKELNIQVDKPLQFLPQDKVGQFEHVAGRAAQARDGDRPRGVRAAPGAHRRGRQARRGEARARDRGEDFGRPREAERRAQRDVERWESYQRNVARLRQMEKKLWLAYEEEDEGRGRLRRGRREGRTREADRAHQLRLAEGAPLTALSAATWRGPRRSRRRRRRKGARRPVQPAEDVEAIDAARSQLSDDRELEADEGKKDAQEASTATSATSRTSSSSRRRRST